MVVGGWRLTADRHFHAHAFVKLPGDVVLETADGRFYLERPYLERTRMRIFTEYTPDQVAEMMGTADPAEVTPDHLQRFNDAFVEAIRPTYERLYLESLVLGRIGL